MYFLPRLTQKSSMLSYEDDEEEEEDSDIFGDSDRDDEDDDTRVSLLQLCLRSLKDVFCDCIVISV